MQLRSERLKESDDRIAIPIKFTTLSLVWHMPPMYLQRSRRYRLAYCSRTNENTRRRQLEPLQSSTAGIPATTSQACQR